MSEHLRAAWTTVLGLTLSTSPSGVPRHQGMARIRKGFEIHYNGKKFGFGKRQRVELIYYPGSEGLYFRRWMRPGEHWFLIDEEDVIRPNKVNYQ